MRLFNYELRKLHPYIDERDLLIRGGGLLQATWGVVQIKMAAAIATASGGALSPLSVALLAMGADNIVAGSSKVITGRPQDTLLNKGLQEGAKLISDDPKFQTNFANYGEFGINLFTGGMAYNQISQPGQMLLGTTYTGYNFGPYQPSSNCIVVGGGRAKGFPIHDSNTITINPNPDALPDIIGVGQNMPTIPSNSTSKVLIERLSYKLLTGKAGRQMFSEVHRILENGGIINGITGSNASMNAIRDALKAVGFKKINVSVDWDGTIIFSGVK
jgi:hypothetical protein